MYGLFVCTWLASCLDVWLGLIDGAKKTMRCYGAGGIRAPEPRVHPRLKCNHRNLVKSKAMRHSLDNKPPNKVFLRGGVKPGKQLTPCLVRGGPFPQKARQGGGKGKREGEMT